MLSPELYLAAEPYLKLVAAGLLTLPTAFHRERHSRIMGIRTFPLVGIGACAYVLVGQSVVGAASPDALARVLQGLLAGIGFVGGGAILKQDDRVAGTASAASIWVTGALGAAIGFGLWGYAVALSILNFCVIYFSPTVKREVDDPTDEEIDD